MAEAAPMSNNELKDLNAYDIQQYQLSCPPWFFIDEITDYVPGKYAKGHKSFTYNEWFFPAHFEDEPTVPGFVQLEALTQVFLMTFLTISEYKGKKTGYISTQCKFRKKIVPGNRLDVEATLSYFKRGIAKGRAIGYVSGEIACEAEMEIAIPDVLAQFRPKV